MSREGWGRMPYDPCIPRCVFVWELGSWVKANRAGPALGPEGWPPRLQPGCEGTKPDNPIQTRE